MNSDRTSKLAALFAGGMLFLYLPIGQLCGQIDPPQQPAESKLLNPLLQPMAAGASSQKPIDVEGQKKLTRDIYNATKTAKTLTDFSGIVDQCSDALTYQLNDSNRTYVRSLKGWALNRRAEKRCELAIQMRKIGSTQQYQKISEQALTDFATSTLFDPKRQRTWNSWGIGLMMDHQWKPAVEKFTRAIELKQDYTAAWFNRAEANFQLEDFQAALEDYAFLVRMDASDVEALNGRGLCHLKLRNDDLALEDFDEVVQQLPKQATGWINRGDVRLAKEQWTEAIGDYTIAVEMDQTSVAKQRLAWVLATCPSQEIRDGKRALALIESAIGAGLDSVAALETLAASKACVGDYQAAQESQQQAIALASGTEELDDASEPKVRLTLYESEQPFVQSGKQE